MKPITLSDGTHIPQNTKLIAPLAGFAFDPAFYPDPETFDPLRFYKLRQRSEEDANRYQFTTLTDVNMNFGAGKHACPGRFFAGNEIKLVLSYFLLRYDFKLREGEKRPKAVVMVMTKAPNMEAEVLFKRRGD